jgi:phosphoribosylanthranilate isomerase
MTAIKICGITRREDADQAAALGASFVGFVMWKNSPRYIPLDRVRIIVTTLPASVTPVGVFVNPTADEVNAATDAGISVAQIHGESNDWHGGLMPGVEVIRAVHLADGRPDAIEPDVPDHRILLDAHDPVRHGGTGKTIDWSRARLVARAREVILAGGLTPHNVQLAIGEVRPFAVDVSSGVELRPGVKDHALLRAFIAAAKGTGT